MASKSKTKVPKYNAVVEDKSNKKNKKKKSVISLISHKLQKKVTKSLLKTFTEITPTTTTTTTKLLKDHSENEDQHNQKETTLSEVKDVKVHSNEINENKKKERKNSSKSKNSKKHQNSIKKKVKEEKNKEKEEESKLLPVPPRYSSNIPVRGSSSNYDVNYYNSNLFDKYSLSQSLPGDINNSKLKNKEHKGLNVKRSNSELTPSSSTENISSLHPDKAFNTNSNSNSATTLVQDSKISLNLLDEIKNNTIHRSDSSESDSSNTDSTNSGSSSTDSSSSTTDTTHSDSSSPYSSGSEKEKASHVQLPPEQFYFDEKRRKTIKQPIHSEKSRKVNELFRRDSEKYMDQQLIDLCSTYYKDYYYGKLSESSSSLDSDNKGVNEEHDRDNDKNSSEKSKSDDEKSNSDSVDDHSYIVKSNSSSSYFNPFRNSGCTITKSNTLPVMDSKRISPKIITCPSSDPDKPTTHLVNISGVTIQTNDLSHLYWVPSYLHPEVHPLEFKKLMSTEANSKSNMFGRRLSIKRTKSFAESARVITPDNISENGEPVINQIQRHKTFDTIQSLRKNQRSNSFKLTKKSYIIEEEKEEDTSHNNQEKLIIHEDVKLKQDSQNDNEKRKIKNEEDKEVTNDEKIQTPIQEEIIEPKLVVDTILPSPSDLPSTETETSPLNVSPTKPLYPSSLINSSSIPDSSSEEKPSQNEDEKITEPPLSPKIFLPNASDENENVPLVHGSHKVDYDIDEALQAKSGWSLWWSSFGKDDRKDTDIPKKSKRSSIGSPKSPFSFFKTKSSTSLVDKNINYRQGKGITKAYLLTYPLIFKPLTREAEDTIYSLCHKKLATTYRPMVQQVFINNIMQKYIRKYKDAAYKVPFKNIRPPKKRRTLPKQQSLNFNNTVPSSTKKQRPVSSPISIVPSSFRLDEPIGVRTDSKKKNRGKKKPYKQQKLVNLDEDKLDELLERGIEYKDINTKKPKRRSKVRPLSDSFSEKDITSIYNNLNHSISMEQLEYYNNSTSSSQKVKYNKYYNNYNNYSNYYASSTSSEEDDDDDDEIPLAMLRNKRSSIITI